MKHINRTILSLTALLLMGGGMAYADSKLTSRDRLGLFQSPQSDGKALYSPAADQTLTATVLLRSAEDVDALEEAGFVPTSVCGKAVIIAFPKEKLEALESLDFVTDISLSKPLAFATDRQRNGTSLYAIDGLTDSHGLPFTGKGVLTGIFDQGFDYLHANFKTPEGDSRIKRAFNVDNNGKVSTVPISSTYTDNAAETHGTHVLGIMAGGYRGDIEYAYVSSGNANEALRTTGENPFYGVAYESDIAVASGELYTTTILAGINAICDLAEQEDKSAVINLSIGLQAGPHDGSGSEAAYMSELGKRAIIVIAAGNDGLKNNCITKTFTDTDGEVKTLLLPDASGLYSSDNGYFDIWAAPGESLVVKMVIYDIITRRVVKEFPLEDDTDSKAVYLTNTDMGDLWGTWHDEKFDQFFTGSHIGYASGTHAENNRKNWYIQYGLNHARPNVSTKLVGFIVKGAAGERTDIYHYSETTQIGSKGHDGWTDPTADGTINDFACADNVLVVGSYNNRSSYPMLSGRITEFEASKGMDREGDISGFSSWGARLDGTRLPHVCAPGSGVISSYSTPYIEACLLSEGSATAMANVDGRANYWWQESGTSMSAPFVSGIVALWLQAAPELTINQAKEVVAETSIRDAFVNEPANSLKWGGAGKIDPAASLRYVLEHFTDPASVSRVADSGKDYAIVWKSGREIEVWSPAESTFDVAIYTVAGTLVEKARGNNGLRLSLDNLQPGVYIVNVAGGRGVYNQKITVGP